jgi:hypothetical protein
MRGFSAVVGPPREVRRSIVISDWDRWRMLTVTMLRAPKVRQSLAPFSWPYAGTLTIWPVGLPSPIIASMFPKPSCLAEPS